MFCLDFSEEIDQVYSDQARYLVFRIKNNPETALSICFPILLVVRNRDIVLSLNKNIKLSLFEIRILILLVRSKLQDDAQLAALFAVSGCELAADESTGFDAILINLY